MVMAETDSNALLFGMCVCVCVCVHLCVFVHVCVYVCVRESQCYYFDVWLICSFFFFFSEQNVLSLSFHLTLELVKWCNCIHAY